MTSANVNQAILTAVVQVIESWVQEHRAIAAVENGMSTRGQRDLDVMRAREKSVSATDRLRELLPSSAFVTLSAGLGSAAPRPQTAASEVARRWGKEKHRVDFAVDLLRTTAVAQKRAAEHAAAAKLAAAEEAEQQAAEEARRAAAEATEAQRLAERATRLGRYRTDANAILQRDFLGADDWFEQWDTSGHVTRDDFDFWKAEFVQTWARKVLTDDQLDIEQALAIASTRNHLRLVARAGSGKTRTIVTRALFLQLHCNVDPGAIMLVAFNRKAVAEIGERLRAALPKSARLPHVVTFHALAYALLRPEEELVFDDEDAESLAQSSKVQDVIDEFLLTRTDDVRRAMLGYFKDSWKAIKRRGLDLDRDEFFRSRREITRVTLAGEYVRSYGERLIANTLYEHDIQYKYERNFTKGGFNYRPDFTILVNRKPHAVIEYFGIRGDPKYLAEAEKKRRFWTEQPDVSFVEYSPEDITRGTEEDFRLQILDDLASVGVAARKLTEDELWDRVRSRAIDAFSKALRGFIDRARQLNLSTDDLLDKLAELNPDDAVAEFVSLAAEVYSRYLERAVSEGYEDFSGVMWRASERVRNGATNWIRAGGKERGNLRDLRFLHIDEFQDFSQMFMEFIQSIRTHAPAVVLCCVGDDWQAINGFAGADLSFFEGFEIDFLGASTRNLATNYRSPRRVVSAGNAVMGGFGTPARPFQESPGRIRISRLELFQPTPAERTRFPGDVGTPALLRMIRQQLDESTGDVAVLFRRNTIPWFINTDQGAFGRKLDGYLKHLRDHFDTEESKRIDLTTAHKYKGREAASVIVADADDRSYPLIHPTARLFEVFGDTIDSLTDDERRLFYVATTRAESSLWYLVTTQFPSPFLQTIADPDEVSWHALPAIAMGPDDMVEVRVYDGFEVREQLKEPFGFTFDEATKTWFVYRPTEGFDFDEVRRRLAFVGARLIEVRNQANEIVHSAGGRLTGTW